MLTKTALEEALTYYPHIAEQIRQVARTRADLVVKRDTAMAQARARGRTESNAAKFAKASEHWAKVWIVTISQNTVVYTLYL